MASGAVRGRGPTGSNAYQASAPVPPEFTRQSRCAYADPPSPEVGWAGCRGGPGAVVEDVVGAMVVDVVVEVDDDAGAERGQHVEHKHRNIGVGKCPVRAVNK